MGSSCSKIPVEDMYSGGVPAKGSGYGDDFSIIEKSSYGKERSIGEIVPVELTMEGKLALVMGPCSMLDTSALGEFQTGNGKPQLSMASSPKSRLTRSALVASRKAGIEKISALRSILSRAASVGFGKAANVLDTVGSSLTSLNKGSSFGKGATTKSKKVSILAFEVAKTIVKGANMMKSLSREHMEYLKEVVLPSEGVQCLVSKDIHELLRIVAADLREELQVFSREVVRFGNQCEDPQWHNLDRYFARLDSEFTPHNQLREMAPRAMQDLMLLVNHTAELYYEMHGLEKSEQGYQNRHQEHIEFPIQKGDELHLVRRELKHQHIHVKNLKNISLWSRRLEEVVSKLVDIVHFLHLEIHITYGLADGYDNVGSFNSHQRLGSDGLELHYANVISQIDIFSARDTLYQALPPNVKSSLRSKLQSFVPKEGLTIPQIKSEMEKILRWLVQIANNTIRWHEGFSWSRMWANTGTAMNRRAVRPTNVLKVETLHHADKARTEAYILDLLLWLHQLIIIQCGPRNGGIEPPMQPTLPSPAKKRLPQYKIHPKSNCNTCQQPTSRTRSSSAIQSAMLPILHSGKGG